MKNRKWIIALFVILQGSSIYSQEIQEPQDSVEVIKKFNARLLESSKTTFSPQMPVFDTSERSYYYQIDLQELELPEVVPDLRPERYHFEDAYDSASPFYAKVGLGIPFNVDAKASYYYENEVSDFHVFADHQNMNFEEEFRDYSYTNGGLSGQIFALDQWRFRGSLFGSRKLDQYTPLQDDPDFDEDDATTTWSRWKAEVSSERYINDWKWTNDLTFLSLKDDSGPKDQQIRMMTSLVKTGSHSTFAVRPGFIIHNISGIFNNVNMNQFFLDGGYAILLNSWSLDLGGQIIHADDRWIPLPDFTLGWSKDNLSLFFSSIGRLTAQSHGYFLTRNPFLNFEGTYDQFMASYTNRMGIKARWNKLKLEATGFVNKFEERGFFIPAINENHFSNVIYQDGWEYGVEAAATMVVARGIETGGEVTLRRFSLENQGKPWYEPNAEIATFVKVHKGKFTSKLRLLMLSGMTYIDDDEDKNLPTFIDLNWGMRYQWADHFAAFLDVNNILNQDNQRLLGYKQPGINFNLGLTYHLTKI